MENSTLNPIPPFLSGLFWRTINCDDLTALGRLAYECQIADGGLVFMNEPDNLKKRYFPDSPGAAIGAFTADEHLIACSTAHLTSVSDMERAIIVGQVQPEWRNQGIGTYLMRWSQAQAQLLSTSARSGKQLLLIATESLTEAAIHRYRTEGFESVFEEIVMERDLYISFPESPLPPDMIIKTWQPDLAGQFFKVYDAAFRGRPGFPGYSAAQWISDYKEDEAFKQEWSLIACTNDGIPMGFVTASARRPGGFVEQVGVIPEQRRHGIASALVVETIRRMRAAGESIAQLTVNVNNPGAIRSYMALGFATVGRRAKYERIANR